jgi:hypothetical protein
MAGGERADGDDGVRVSQPPPPAGVIQDFVDGYLVPVDPMDVLQCEAVSRTRRPPRRGALEQPPNGGSVRHQMERPILTLFTVTHDSQTESGRRRRIVAEIPEPQSPPRCSLSQSGYAAHLNPRRTPGSRSSLPLCWRTPRRAGAPH